MKLLDPLKAIFPKMLQRRYLIFALLSILTLIVVSYFVNTFVSSGKVVSTLFIQKSSIAELGKELNSTKTSFYSCLLRIDELQNKFSNLEGRYYINLNETIKIENERRQLNATLETCQINVTTLSEKVKTLQSDYDALAIHAGNNICCKKKVDEPSINYFYISNNIVVCSVNETAGSRKISCPA